MLWHQANYAISMPRWRIVYDGRRHATVPENSSVNMFALYQPKNSWVSCASYGSQQRVFEAGTRAPGLESSAPVQEDGQKKRLASKRRCFEAAAGSCFPMSIVMPS